MFDIDASEFLVIAVVAVVAIGPKDLPRALRTAGRLIGKMRRISGHVRSGFETMIRDAEIEEIDRREQEQRETAASAQVGAATVDASRPAGLADSSGKAPAQDSELLAGLPETDHTAFERARVDEKYAKLA